MLCFTAGDADMIFNPCLCVQWMALTGCVFLSVLSVFHLGFFICDNFPLTSLNRKCSLWRFLSAELVS